MMPIIAAVVGSAILSNISLYARKPPFSSVASENIAARVLKREIKPTAMEICSNHAMSSARQRARSMIASAD